MKPVIEMLVSPTGDISIEGQGFKGADCEKATQFLEDALGLVNQRIRKPEYHQHRTHTRLQRIGT